MSVAIATMGKYLPIFQQKVIVDSGGGSSYGWKSRRPQIIVDSVYDEDNEMKIKITKVTEWS